MNAISCDRCKGDTEFTVVSFVDGEAGPLTIRLRDFPLLCCEQGHRQFARRQFAAELLEHLTQQDEPELPSGEQKGFFKKHYLCQDCGAELEPKSDHRHTFSIDIKLEDLDAFGVNLSMPVYKCSTCAKEQLHSLDEIRRLTPEALAHAFEAAGIPPPPGQI